MSEEQEFKDVTELFAEAHEERAFGPFMTDKERAKQRIKSTREAADAAIADWPVGKVLRWRDWCKAHADEYVHLVHLRGKK